ncbi:MAG: hypothetical protein GY835_19270 [bacterium]|nr:hypothetical protein [bacterium]
MRHTFMPRIIRTGVLAAVATAAACGLSDAAGSAPNLIADPPSTLLAPGTTELTLTVRSATATECRYAVGEALGFEAMTPFDPGRSTIAGPGLRIHETRVTGIDADPNTLNEIYVRCAAYPEELLELRYRCLSEVNPSFPRTGNLWGSWEFLGEEPSAVARIDLWLGADDFRPADIRELRQLNPDIRILTSINAIENAGLPEEYYLHDIDGERIEVWPGSYRLNLTRPQVAEYQARLAYQSILDGELMFDGCFFDNVMTSQSWQTEDIYGNPFLVDADEDGIQDDPATFDAAWKAGVFHELRVFRRLMPHAVMSGHAMDIFEPGIAEIFNGISIGFMTADVIEHEMSFAELWTIYNAWQDRAQSPTAIMFESSPIDQIAYGYDYAPWGRIPPSTLEFARTYFPWVRFGLALTLLGDGYFAHELGDTWHGNAWWYDELDYDLGHPLGPAETVPVGEVSEENLVDNGDFEEPLDGTWRLWVATEEGCAASVSRDTTVAARGLASARIDVAATSGVDWHIEFAQFDRSLVEGTAYQLVFRARAETERRITVSAQKGSPDWRNYGLLRTATIGTQWAEYTLAFEANESTEESRIQFLVGEVAREGSRVGAWPSTIWLDDVRLVERAADVLRREFTRGLVLLNASREGQEIAVGAGYRRLSGEQAPRHQWILDDAGAGFSTAGAWTAVSYDSGEWQASGPFYHDWGEGCHQSSGSGDEARWELAIPEQDFYTITAWWPAAPSSGSWSRSAVYEVVAGGAVVGSATLDQSSGGDEWHEVAEVLLAPDDDAFVRLRSGDAAPAIADALHLRSAARFNDGSPVDGVTLQPMDGIVLARIPSEHGTAQR